MMILTAGAAIGVLTVVLASLLLLASRRYFVHEDPKIDRVQELLPQSNCGACGYAGCRAFAKALVDGEANPAQCSVSSEAGREKVASFLGVEIGKFEKQVARLACAGGSNVARVRADYLGPPQCVSAATVAGGGKDCVWGCLGYGDCEAVCDFDAIAMNQFGLPVVDSALCTACGDCVAVCPKDLFSLQSIDNALWVRCKNQERGDDILLACESACTACGRCALDAPAQTVVMKDNLPYVRQELLKHASVDAIQRTIDRCPTGAIVRFDENDHEIKGVASKVVLRQTSRPTALP